MQNTGINKYCGKKGQILEEILAWLACKCKTMESTNTAQQKETNTCRNNGPAELRNWRCTSNRCSAATNASLKILAIENSCPHSDYSKKYTFFRVRAILKALEARKVKLSCFKGIVDPTDIHGSWGTWLGCAPLYPRRIPPPHRCQCHTRRRSNSLESLTLTPPSMTLGNWNGGSSMFTLQIAVPSGPGKQGTSCTMHQNAKQITYKCMILFIFLVCHRWACGTWANPNS